jgi:hypothetical protein
MKSWFKTFKDSPLKSIGSYVQGNIDALRDKYKDSIPHWMELEQHVKEQILYREENSQCNLLDACKSCGCKIPELFYAKKACNEGCYPELMDKQSWEYYKEHLKIPQGIDFVYARTVITGAPLEISGVADEHKNLDVVVTNSGENKFVLEKIVPSCGCTVPDYKQGEVINPGESKTFKAVVVISNKFTTLSIYGNADMIAIPLKISIV